MSKKITRSGGPWGAPRAMLSPADRADIVSDTLSDCLADFGLPPLSQTPNVEVLVDGEEGNRTPGQPWLGVVVRENSIKLYDFPPILRDGTHSTEHPSLREFIEYYIKRNSYLLKRRYQHREAMIFIPYALSLFYIFKKNSIYPIIHKMNEVKQSPIRRRLHKYLNSGPVKDACRRLNMPGDNPNEEYIGAFACDVPPFRLKDVRDLCVQMFRTKRP